MSELGALSPAEVDSWVADASPGEEKVYAWGREFPRSQPGVKATRRHGDDGLVTFTTRRSHGRVEYVMFRSAKQIRAEKAAAAKASSKGGYFVPDETVALIMRMLRDAANHCRPCPTNAELARRAKLADEHAASYVVGKLKRAGRIKVELVGPGQRRVITIVSSGAGTLMERR